jgi:hypothetical protein
MMRRCLAARLKWLVDKWVLQRRLCSAAPKRYALC